MFDSAYVVLFLSLLVVGDSALIPAVYYTATGRLEALPVFAVAFVAILLSDVVWYFIGMRLRNVRAVEGFRDVFSKRPAAMLFASKFVYGTRLAARLLSGAARMPIRTYLGVNAVGTLCLFAVLFALVHGVNIAADGLGSVVKGGQLVLLGVLAAAVVAYMTVGIFVRKKWKSAGAARGRAIAKDVSAS